MIITATSAAIGIWRPSRPRNTTISSRNDAGHQAGQPAATAGFHVDHRLADHRAAGHAAEKPETMLATPWPLHSRFLSLGGVGQVVDDLRGHQGFEQADHRQRQRVGQMIAGSRRSAARRAEEDRQAVRQFAHVADGADIQDTEVHRQAVSTTMHTSGEGISAGQVGQQ
jgi:hypothetical protein